MWFEWLRIRFFFVFLRLKIADPMLESFNEKIKWMSRCGKGLTKNKNGRPDAGKGQMKMKSGFPDVGKDQRKIKMAFLTWERAK